MSCANCNGQDVKWIIVIGGDPFEFCDLCKEAFDWGMAVENDGEDCEIYTPGEFEELEDGG